MHHHARLLLKNTLRCLLVPSGIILGTPSFPFSCARPNAECPGFPTPKSSGTHVPRDPGINLTQSALLTGQGLGHRSTGTRVLGIKPRMSGFQSKHFYLVSPLSRLPSNLSFILFFFLYSLVCLSVCPSASVSFSLFHPLCLPPSFSLFLYFHVKIPWPFCPSLELFLLRGLVSWWLI